jgi:L-asparagine transporter-like permease
MWQHRYNRSQQSRSVGGTLALYLLRLVVAGGLIALFVRPDKFSEYAHGAAGVLLLSAFIATVFTSAYLAKREEPSPDRRNYGQFYKWIAWAMLLTLIAVVTVHIRHPELFGVLWVTILESAVILEFGAYWVVQTIDLWDSPDRSERLPDADRERLAQKRTTRGLAGLKSELFEARNADWGDRLLPLL